MRAQLIQSMFRGREALGLMIGAKTFWLSYADDRDFELHRAVGQKLADLWNRDHAQGKPELPKNEDEAVELGVVAGVPREFCIMVYHQLNGRGWVDGKELPIKHFRSHLLYRWINERGTFEAGKPESVFALTKRIEAIDSEILRMTEREHLDYGSFRDQDGKLLPEHKENLKKLRDQRKKFHSQLIGIQL